MNSAKTKLTVGDWVEVRSKEEILRTLDANGRLDGMPFMPEMFAFCGLRFQIYKSAHKTCDTVFPVRGRRVHNAIHLDTRCDGSAHGGCQASCMLFWKDAWLKSVNDSPTTIASSVNSTAGPGCTELDVFAGAQTIDPQTGETVYACQATQLPYATTDLEWWDISQYVEDYRSGNVSLWRIISGAVYAVCYSLCNSAITGRAMRWFYAKFYPLWGGVPFPRKTGNIPVGEPTPAESLDLQPGELVRIKSHDEILKTLNTASRNRGLYWDAEEVPYCGGTYQVLKRVDKIVDERTGRMRWMKTPCIILDSVICQSRYSECRYFCPRSIYSYWREIWLERVAVHQRTPGMRDQGEACESEVHHGG